MFLMQKLSNSSVFRAISMLSSRIPATSDFFFRQVSIHNENNFQYCFLPFAFRFYRFNLSKRFEVYDCCSSNKAKEIPFSPQFKAIFRFQMLKGQRNGIISYLKPSQTKCIVCMFAVTVRKPFTYP